MLTKEKVITQLTDITNQVFESDNELLISIFLNTVAQRLVEFSTMCIVTKYQENENAS